MSTQTSTIPPLYMWDHTDDDARVYEREANGTTYRARVERDEYPSAPDWSYMPVRIRLSWRGYESRATLETDDETGSGDMLTDALTYFLERMRKSDALDTFDRYVRAFHAGATRELTSTVYQGEDTFVIVETRAMLDARGCTPDVMPDAEDDEWQAYLDGDVYVVSVEVAAERDDEGDVIAWDTIEGPIGGYYGEAIAAEEAIAMLDACIADDARGMLPAQF